MKKIISVLIMSMMISMLSSPIVFGEELITEEYASGQTSDEIAAFSEVTQQEAETDVIESSDDEESEATLLFEDELAMAEIIVEEENDFSLLGNGQATDEFFIDFEDSSLSGWSVSYDVGGQPAVIGDSSIFGSKALQIVNVSPKYKFNVQANTVYIMSSKIASTIDGGKRLQMHVQTQTGSDIARVNINNPAKNEIQKMSAMFASGENTALQFLSVNYDSKWAHYDDQEVDDVKLERLKLTSEIMCDNTTVVLPQGEETTAEYDISITVKNQYDEVMTTSTLISSIDREWTIEGEATEGISVDGETGKLILTQDTQKGEIIVKCKTTVNFNGADPIVTEASETFTIRDIPEYKEKDIKKLVDYDFEDGSNSGWSHYHAPGDVGIFKKEVVYDETAKSNVLHFFRAEGNISFSPEPNTLYIALAKMGANGDSFQRLHFQLIDNNNKDTVVFRQKGKPIGYTPYTLDSVFYSGDRTSIKYSFVGYDGAWLYGDYWLDDVIIAEHKPVININGADSIVRPRNANGTNTAKFEADVTDLTGTDKYIIPDSEKISWVLNDDYPGVSIDNQTGEITISGEAEYGEIELVCNVSAETTAVLSTVDGVEETKNYTISNTAIKKIAVTPILPVVSNILPKVSFSDTDIKLDCDYTYSHYENVKEKDSLFSWQISENSDDGFSEISSLKKAEIPFEGNKDKYLKLVITPRCENEGETGNPVETTTVKISELFNAVAALEKAELSLEADSKIQRGSKLSIKAVPEDVKSEFEWYRNKDGNDEKIACEDADYYLGTDDLDSEIYGIAIPYSSYKEYKIYGNAVSTNKVEGLSRPVVDNVVINGTASVGNILTGKYKYSHKNGVAEGESIYSWEMGGAKKSSEATYTVTANDAGKTLTFTVTPVSEDGINGESKTVSVTVAYIQYSQGGSLGGSSFSGFGSSSVKPGTSESVNSSPVPDSFEGFSDTKNHWANENIIEMYKKGIAKGNGDNFYPDNKITRAETAAFIARALGVDSDEPKENVFSDVKTSDWYYNNIGILNELNILKGNEGLATPNNNITREELACLIIRALEYKLGELPAQTGAFFFDSSNISDWAKDSVEKASGLKLVEGNNLNFLPKNNATRAETVTILKRMIDYIETNTKTED